MALPWHEASARHRIELQHDRDAAVPTEPHVSWAAAGSVVCQCPSLSQMRLAGLVTPRARGIMLLVPYGLKSGSQGQPKELV